MYVIFMLQLETENVIVGQQLRRSALPDVQRGPVLSTRVRVLGRGQDLSANVRVPGPGGGRHRDQRRP